MWPRVTVRGAFPVPLLLVAAVVSAGIWCLMQTPVAPDAVAVLHELVGIFGLPGAAVFTLAGWLLYQKGRGKVPDPGEDLHLQQQIDRLVQSLHDDARQQRLDLSEDLKNAIMLAGGQLELVLKRELAAQKDSRKRA